MRAYGVKSTTGSSVNDNLKVDVGDPLAPAFQVAGGFVQPDRVATHIGLVDDWVNDAPNVYVKVSVPAESFSRRYCHTSAASSPCKIPMVAPVMTLDTGSVVAPHAV